MTGRLAAHSSIEFACPPHGGRTRPPARRRRCAGACLDMPVIPGLVPATACRRCHPHLFRRSTLYTWPDKQDERRRIEVVRYLDSVWTGKRGKHYNTLVSIVGEIAGAWNSVTRISHISKSSISRRLCLHRNTVSKACRELAGMGVIRQGFYSAFKYTSKGRLMREYSVFGLPIKGAFLPDSISVFLSGRGVTAMVSIAWETMAEKLTCAGLAFGRAIGAFVHGEHRGAHSEHGTDNAGHSEAGARMPAGERPGNGHISASEHAHTHHRHIPEHAEVPPYDGYQPQNIAEHGSSLDWHIRRRAVGTFVHDPQPVPATSNDGTAYTTAHTQESRFAGDAPDGTPSGDSPPGGSLFHAPNAPCNRRHGLFSGRSKLTGNNLAKNKNVQRTYNPPNLNSHREFEIEKKTEMMIKTACLIEGSEGKGGWLRRPPYKSTMDPNQQGLPMCEAEATGGASGKNAGNGHLETMPGNDFAANAPPGHDATEHRGAEPVDMFATGRGVNSPDGGMNERKWSDYENGIRPLCRVERCERVMDMFNNTFLTLPSFQFSYGVPRGRIREKVLELRRGSWEILVDVVRSRPMLTGRRPMSNGEYFTLDFYWLMSNASKLLASYVDKDFARRERAEKVAADKRDAQVRIDLQKRRDMRTARESRALLKSRVYERNEVEAKRLFMELKPSKQDFLHSVPTNGLPDTGTSRAKGVPRSFDVRRKLERLVAHYYKALGKKTIVLRDGWGNTLPLHALGDGLTLRSMDIVHGYGPFLKSDLPRKPYISKGINLNKRHDAVLAILRGFSNWKKLHRDLWKHGLVIDFVKGEGDFSAERCRVAASDPVDVVYGEWACLVVRARITGGPIPAPPRLDRRLIQYG